MGRYGVRRSGVAVALWVGFAGLVVACALLAAVLWMVRVVGAWVWVLAVGVRDRVGVLDLVMDTPRRADVAAAAGGVVQGVVVSVRYEDKETVGS